MDSSNKRMKIASTIVTAVLLMAVGAVVLNNVNGGSMAVHRAEAVVKYENAEVPLAHLPDEADVRMPEGWEVESDKAVAGAPEEVLPTGLDHSLSDVREDDDIDSPLDVEEDENGDKYVAELGEDVIVSEDDGKTKKEVVAEDRRRGCFAKLKKCGFRKKCHRVCKRKCKPRAVKICRAKKFCKCFCKYFKNIKQAKTCVFYKKKTCRKAVTFRCLRWCNKFCNKVPRCYCCSKKHIRSQCRRRCRKISYATKCGKCRCFRLKCYKYCRFACRKYK